MSGRTAKRAFAARPGDADAWVRTRDALPSIEPASSLPRKTVLTYQSKL